MEFILVALVAAVMLTLVGEVLRRGDRTYVDGLTELTDGWYRLENGEKIPVELPGEIEIQGDLVLYNDQAAEDWGGSMLTTRGALYRMEILLGDRMLYRYEDTGFPRNEQMRSKVHCAVRLPDHMEGPVTLIYRDIGHDTYSIQPVYCGSSGAAFRSYCAGDAFNLTIVFLMLVVSGIAVWVSAYFRKVHVRDRRFADAAAFLLLCSAWCILDSSLVQYLSGMSPVVCYLSFYAFMTLSIPMIHFVRNTGDMKKYRVLDLCLGLFYLNALVQGILDLFGVFDLIDMLFVTHILLAGGVTVLAGLIIREYLADRKNKELRTILSAFITVSVGGVLALLLYWALGISFYGLIFEFGILVFILILLDGLIGTVVEDFRFRTEARVYQRLSREDQLTGLKNRRAFDELLAELERAPEEERDAVLLFADLDGLKRTNDAFGHTEGDELIIRAARSLQEAFDGLGECFRIGGDEFCVLLPPAEDWRPWNERLDHVIRQMNQGARCPLSLARGYSRRRRGDGTLKTVSDWKYEADRDMYRDKAERKAHSPALLRPVE